MGITNGGGWANRDERARVSDEEEEESYDTVHDDAQRFSKTSFAVLDGSMMCSNFVESVFRHESHHVVVVVFWWAS